MIMNKINEKYQCQFNIRFYVGLLSILLISEIYFVGFTNVYFINFIGNNPNTPRITQKIIIGFI
jgi:hypothetical protein